MRQRQLRLDPLEAVLGQGKRRKNGEPTPRGWIAEQTSWTKPGRVSSVGAQATADRSAASSTSTDRPARARSWRRPARSGPSPPRRRRRSGRPRDRAACSCVSIIRASRSRPMPQWARHAAFTAGRRRARAGAPPQASRRDRTPAAHPVLRHQPRPLLHRRRPSLRPPREPLLEGAARLRVHSPPLLAQRGLHPPLVRNWDHEPVPAHDGQRGRA